MAFSHLWQFHYAESLAADARTQNQDEKDNINKGNITFSEPRPVVSEDLKRSQYLKLFKIGNYSIQSLTNILSIF